MFVLFCCCIAKGVEVDEDKLMDKVYTVFGVISFITILAVFFLIYELISHLIP